MSEETIAKIQQAVERTANCPATHLRTVMVLEFWREQVVFQNEVEIFVLKDHPQAKQAYGWQTGSGEDAQFTAVLEIPPVDSANTAVRAAIVAKAKRKT